MLPVVAQHASAQIASDRAAAIVVYPLIHVSSADGIDTTVQLSNTSDQPANIRCFYVNANGHCSDSGTVCFAGSDCDAGLCLPGWIETDFFLVLTARQPLIWQASRGLSGFPLDGTTRRGPNGQSNAGSRIPRVGDDPFVGELKCIVVDAQDRPSERNVLVGSAATEQVLGGFVDIARYNAVGIAAVSGANNGDNTLVLGQEYHACPNTLILDHFFDGAINPVTGDTILGALALVPCSEDFVRQDRNLPRDTVQFLVFNEFEQRFSTSTCLQCFGLFPLSSIDTFQPTHSIFSVTVEGTLTGQTRIRGVGTGGHGLVGVYFDLHGDHSSAANLHFQGIPDQPDVIRLP